MTSDNDRKNRVFLCLWVPTMYHEECKSQLRLSGIQHAIVRRFSELKTMAEERCSAGLPFTHLLIDGGMIRESIEVVCNDVLTRCAEVHITVVVPSLEERVNPRVIIDRLSKAAEKAPIAFIPAEAFSLPAYLHRVDPGEASSTITAKRMYRHSKPPVFDAIAMDDNDLAKVIDEELATISASIHLDDKLLEDGYVCPSGDAPDVDKEPDSSTALAAAAQEYTAFIDRWRTREKNRDDFAKEVVYHYMTKARRDADMRKSANTEKEADLYVLHKKLSHWLEVRNRRTYMLVGQRGSGKTTFLHFFRLFYAPRRNIFIVDFLPFNFKADAQQVFLKLETDLFEMLKADGRSEIVQPFTSHYEYRAAVRGEAPSCLYAECLRLQLQLPSSKMQRWVEEVLFNCTSAELVRIWRDATAQASSASLDKCNAEPLLSTARTWRDQVIRTPPPELVAVLCKTFRDDWQVGPVEWFACSLVEDIVHVAKNPIPDSGDRSQRLLNALTETARELGIPFNAILDLSGQAIVRFAKAVVRRIGNPDDPVIIFVDNADRAVAPSTEVEIFKNSWQYLFDRSGKAKLLFAVRAETYQKHKTIFDHLDQSQLAESTAKYADRVANIAKLGLLPPRFAEILQARIYAVSRQLERKNRAKTTRAVFQEYVCRARADEDLNRIFDVLFGGDFRTNLELFESALRSPHIVGSDLHFVAKRRLDGNDTSPELDVHIQRHRLLTAVMLRNHAAFQQDRAGTVILNVYNANLLDADGTPAPENTLLLLRALRYVRALDAKPIGIASADLAAGLSIPKDHARQAFSLLEAFHLIGFADEKIEAEGARMSITDAGNYYLDSLVARLEYLQAVCWETWIDEDLACTGLPIEDIADLLPFVDRFVEFLVREEGREAARNQKNPAFETLMNAICRDEEERSPSRGVQRVALDQVMRIYFAERRRL